MNTRISRLLGLCCWLMVGFGPTLLSAQTGLTELPGPTEISEWIAQVEAQTDLPPDQATATLEALRAALAFAEQAAEEEEAIGSMLQQAEDLDESLARLQDPDPPIPAAAPADDASIGDIEAWVGRQQVELDRLIERRSRLNREVERLRQQPDAIRRELEATSQLPSLPALDDMAWTELTPSTALTLRAAWEREALRDRSRRLEVEMNTLEARIQLASAEHGAVSTQVDRLQEALSEQRDRLSARRLSMTLQTATDVREMRQQLEGAAPLLVRLADENVRQAEALAVDAADTRAMQERLRDQQAKLEEVQQTLERVNQILSIDNLPVAYSEQLREERQRLTWIRQIETSARQRQEQTALKRVQQIEIREQLRMLRAPEARRAAALPGWDLLSAEERAQAEPLIEKQRELLTERERALDEYQRIRGQIDLVEARLLQDGRAMQEMLDARLIWTRSLRPVDVKWFTEQHANLQRFVTERERYFGTPNDLLLLLNRQKFPLAGGLVMLVVAFKLARRIRARMALLSEKIDRLLTDRFVYTLEAMLWTVLLAAIWPALLVYLGRMLTVAARGDLVQAAGHGLGSAAWILFACCLLREICKPKGLAKDHFLWPEPVCKNLYRAAGGARWIYPSLFALTILFLWPGEEWLRSGPARLAYLVMLLLLAWRAHRLFRRHSGVLETWLDGASVLLQRLFPLCSLALTATLLALAVAVLRGYFYTARMILLHLAYVAIVVFAAVLVHNLALRWMRVARRRYAIAQIRKRRREAKTGGTATAEGESAGIQVKDLEPYDVDALNDQTRRLLRLAVVVGTGLVLLTVFRPLLPALGILESVSLWQRVDGTFITLHHLLIALLAAFLTVAAARNIPGVLEMTLLPLFPMKNSSRFALVTLVRYFITIIGIFVTFGAVGIGWGQVQWMAAAITVGLGFGLQEIFANFVSGLIILFEQPIRVGDIVTIEGTTGVVSRIQMRATTITDWDRKELIVPNKEFVTSRLLNWTLSDSITRIFIPVGVAYGSDVVLAMETLIRVAREHPLVMSDPKPMTSFEGFGDNTLNLTLRAYLPSLECRLATTTELHVAIDKAFREAGIEIAFPQRDLHIRSMDEKVARLLDGQRKGAPRQGTDD